MNIFVKYCKKCGKAFDIGDGNLCPKCRNVKRKILSDKNGNN